MDYKGRQRRLLQAMEAKGLDALLVTHLPNVRYLCGFTGSAGVLLAGASPVLVTDGRYTAQARQEVKGARVVTAKGPALSAAAEQAADAGAPPRGLRSRACYGGRASPSGPSQAACAPAGGELRTGGGAASGEGSRGG